MVELLLQVRLVLEHLDEICEDPPSTQQHFLVDFLACRPLAREEILLVLGHLLVTIWLCGRCEFNQVVQQSVANAKEVIWDEEVRDPLLD